VVVRVEALDWFLEIYPPLTIALTTWRSSQGAWVVVVSYQLRPAFGGTKGGIFYWNPHQAADAEILRKLLRQETLFVVFLSEDCEMHYTVGVMQDPQEVARWWREVDEMNRTFTQGKPGGASDLDFEAAVRELQEQL